MFVKPLYKQGKRFYRNYMGGSMNYIVMIVVSCIGYELFVIRTVHRPVYNYCCKTQKKRVSAPKGAKDIAR